MSANDSKIYYWLKLKKDFFDSHRIKIIEDMPNGKDYVLFYLKMMCEATSHQGKLRFSDSIPYTESMLSSLTNTKIDSVHSALGIFGQLDMIVLLDDGTYYLPEVEKLIGKETGQAIRKRESRENKENSDEGGKIYPTNTAQVGTTYPRDKSIESRDKSIDNSNNNVLDKSNPSLLQNDIQDIHDKRLLGLTNKPNPLLSRLLKTDYVHEMNGMYINEYNDMLELLCKTYGTGNVSMSLDYFIEKTIDYEFDRKTMVVTYKGVKANIKHRFAYFQESMLSNCEKFMFGSNAQNDKWAKSLGFNSCKDMHEYFENNPRMPLDNLKNRLENRKG